MRGFFLFSIILIIALTIHCKSPALTGSPVLPISQTTYSNPDSNLILPPAWAFGILYGAYTNQDQTIDLIEQIIAHDYPIDAFWIDSWIWDWKNKGKGPEKYLDFLGDTVSYPNLEAMWRFMEERNIKAGMWVWDCIMKTGNEQAYEAFKSKGYFNREYVETNSWHNGSRTTIIGDNSKPVAGTWCGNIDFNNPEAAAFFKTNMKPFFDKGLDFIKLDRTDAIPTCKTMFEMTQTFGRETGGRGFIFSHSGGTQSETYKRYPAKWTDDTRSDWSALTHTRPFSPWLPKVGFQENIARYTDTSRPTHKIPFLANDMGGFAISTDGYIDEELFIRWLQFACLVPITTPFSQPENLTGNIPFLVSKRADTLFREFSHIKMSLFPYIYTLAHLARLNSERIIRPIPGHLYQYLLGPSMLVAPVYEQGRTMRTVYFPEDTDWVDYWTGRVYSGGNTVEVDAPLDRIPVFIRQGAIIPQRKYARSIEAGNNEVLELHLYPGANGSFDLIEDDGRSNDYLIGRIASTPVRLQGSSQQIVLQVDAVNGDFQNMKARRQWEVVIHAARTVKTVQLNGKSIAFRQDKNSIRINPFQMAKSKPWVLRVNIE